MSKKALNLSRRPYLVRAIYEWISDSNLTPYLVVAADQPNVSVPMSHVKEGRITLNVGASAVHHWAMDTTTISFSARFGGVPFPISVPMAAVVAIYAQESGEGMVFGDPEPIDADADATSDSLKVQGSDADTSSAKRSRAHLKVVK